jgi:hypothetical protein
MMDDAGISINELRRRRGESTLAGEMKQSGALARQMMEPVVIETRPRSVPTQTEPRPRPGGRPQKPEPTFDSSRFFEAARRRWYWLAIALFVGAAVGSEISFWRSTYSLPVTFTLRDLSSSFLPGADADSYQPPKISAQSRIDFLSSPELLRYLGAHTTPPTTAHKLRARLAVESDKESDTVVVTVKGKDPGSLRTFANLYTATAIQQSRLAQLENPNLTYSRFSQRIAETEKQQAELNQKLANLRTTAGIVSPLAESAAYEKDWTDTQLKIDIDESELQQLQTRAVLLKDETLQKELRDAESRLIALKAQGKLDAHPDIVRVRDEIADLQRQLTNGTGPEGATPETTAVALRKRALEVEIKELKNRASVQKEKIDRLYENAGEYTKLKATLDLLHTFHEKLERRMFEAQQYRENAEGYYKVAAPPSLEDVDTNSRHVAVAQGGMAGGGLGLALALLLVCGTERLDPRLKTAADVKRVTGLPVLASLGNLDKMDEAARKAWAFRTWTILSDSLGESGNSGTVCGIISCAHGEGRTTWVELLVEAARQRGLEVTKLQFQHDAGNAQETDATADYTPTEEAAPANSTALTTTVAGTLAHLRSTPVVHIQLPGLVWDLERRIQFQQELEKWQNIPHAVVLVDLPPASLPEAILLAENLPQVLWLVDSGKSHARETRLHLETLRHARCKLVGAVLNHEPEPLIKL